MKALQVLLTGLAAGDSLGSTSEFRRREEVPRLYQKEKAKGWPFAQVGGGAFGWKRGDPTDDTDMAMCLVESFLELKRFDGADIAKRFVKWMKSGPPDIGGTTRATLAAVARGTPWQRGGLTLFEGNPGGAANGSLMRNGVVAGMAQSLDQAFTSTLHHGVITHYAPLAVLCCQAQTYLLWELLHKRTPAAGSWVAAFETCHGQWLESCQDEVVQEWKGQVKGHLAEAGKVFRSAQWDPDVFSPFTHRFGGDDGYCLLTLQIAVWALFWSLRGEPVPTPTGFPEEVFAHTGAEVLGIVAMVGHDSDTYGAVAGPLIAAAHGGLPASMTQGLRVLKELGW